MGFVVAVVPVWLHAHGPRAGSAARPKGRRVWLSFGVGLHFMCQVIAVVLRHSLVTSVSHWLPAAPDAPPLPHQRASREFHPRETAGSGMPMLLVDDVAVAVPASCGGSWWRRSRAG